MYPYERQGRRCEGGARGDAEGGGKLNTYPDGKKPGRQKTNQKREKKTEKKNRVDKKVTGLERSRQDLCRPKDCSDQTI